MNWVAHSLSVFLNLESVLYLLAKPMIQEPFVSLMEGNHLKMPECDYLFSEDPLLIDEDRVNHDIDKSRCTVNHENFVFKTRCPWMLFAVFRRSFIALKNFRDKVCRNLSFVLPGGYQSIESINPERYVGFLNAADV